MLHLYLPVFAFRVNHAYLIELIIYEKEIEYSLSDPRKQLFGS